MAKVETPVDRNVLIEAIAEVEKNGPLPNRDALHKAVAPIYNRNKPGTMKSIEFSVVMLRIKKWEIPVKTPMGKRGRAAGVPLSDEQKQRMQEGRAAARQGNERKAKGDKHPDAGKVREHLTKQLTDMGGDRFVPLVDKMIKGSTRAERKLTCVICMGCQIKEIKRCGDLACPHFLKRPFQNVEIVIENGIETIDEAADAAEDEAAESVAA